MKLIAHRGASLKAPENTLAAFELAVESGFDFIECDVQFSQDHLPYIFHDETLDRTSNGHGLFQCTESFKIDALDAGSWKSNVFKNEKIPRLEHSLKFLNEHRQCHMNLELKPDQRYFSQNYRDKIVQMIQAHRLEKRVVFSSFDFLLIKMFAQKFPELRYAALIDNHQSLALYEDCGLELEAYHMSKEYFFHHFSKTNKIHNFPEIRIYTVNDESVLKQCELLGAKKVFTDGLSVV